MSVRLPFIQLEGIFDEQFARFVRDPVGFPRQLYLFRGGELVASVERPFEGEDIVAFGEIAATSVVEHDADGLIVVTKGQQVKLPWGAIPGSSGRVVLPEAQAPEVKAHVRASAHVKGTNESAVVYAIYELDPTTEQVRLRDRATIKDDPDAVWPFLEPVFRVWNETSETAKT